MPTGSRLLVWSALLIPLLIPSTFNAQVGVVGKIIGNVRISRGDFPDHPVLISLEMRGSAISSAYTDGQGRFGFYNLIANPYKITVNDDTFEPFSVNVDLNPDTAPMAFVQVTLVPRANAKKDPLSARVTGSNPALVDPAEYKRQFPKKTVKEFEKGVEADHKGNPEEAIQHYLKALTYSPDFYPAHNNLGTVYLSRKDFEAAQSQFEAALTSNQNDGQAYFNLANVCILMNRFPDARRYLDDGFRRQPQSVLGEFLLGTLNIRTDKLSEAEVALKKAIELDPSMAQPRLQLINLFLKQGRKTDAIGQLHAFLTAIPLSPYSSQAKQMLQRLETTQAQAGATPQPDPKH
jgi:tetratricopeptide (TPR) repeat protein